MKFDPENHRRRSIRLKGFDYARAGAYFVTVCVQGRECLFGEIEAGRVILSEAGRMVQSVWEELPTYYPGVHIDSHVVMPQPFPRNHMARRGRPPCLPGSFRPPV